MAKKQKRGPKQQYSTGTGDIPEKSSKSKPKRKTSKSAPATRKTQTKYNASSADETEHAVNSSDVEMKSRSRLSTIPEEAEQYDDQRPKNANRGRGKRKDAEKLHAGLPSPINQVNYGLSSDSSSGCR